MFFSWPFFFFLNQIKHNTTKTHSIVKTLDFIIQRTINDAFQAGANYFIDTYLLELEFLEA